MVFFKEFKDFATRGNVVDLAVGIIIGGAFGKIVSSLVEDVLMPPIGFLLGGVNFTDIKWKLNPAQLDPTGLVTSAPVTLNVGEFAQTMVDFTIIAFAIFLLIKGLNALQKKKEEAPAAAAAPPEDIVLLREIRDLLKKGK
jgi:large conductance mechanosensitive channel